MCVSFKIPKVRYRLQFRGQTTHGNREGSVAQVARLLGAGAGRHALQISARETPSMDPSLRVADTAGASYLYSYVRTRPRLHF